MVLGSIPNGAGTSFLFSAGGVTVAPMSELYPDIVPYLTILSSMLHYMILFRW